MYSPFCNQVVDIVVGVLHIDDKMAGVAVGVMSVVGYLVDVVCMVDRMVDVMVDVVLTVDYMYDRMYDCMVDVVEFHGRCRFDGRLHVRPLVPPHVRLCVGF